jgi:Tol biopolymer transport system component
MPATGSQAPGDITRVSPTTDQWNFHPQLSPDGGQVVFQSTRSGQYELWLVDHAGARATQLTTSSIYKSMPRWSPDGRHLVFVTRTKARWEVSVLDVASHAVRVVVEDDTGAVAPSWTHDSQALYFGSRRGGSWQIWRVAIAGGQPEPVTTDGGYAALESADGRTLYFTRLERRGLWRRPTGHGPTELVTDLIQPEDWPSWGVTTRGLYFLQRPDDGDPVAMLLDPREQVPQALGRLSGYAWSGLSVSADVSHILFAHTERRDANILSIQFAPRPLSP